MPTKVFTDLKDDKKQRIIDAATEEFADNGYINASTNSIVSKCGISKGSLFKYFDNKEDLYFFLVETISSKLGESIARDLKDLPEDAFDRIIAYSSLEISWYIKNPVKGRFMMRMAGEKGEIADKLTARYNTQADDTYFKFMEDAGFKRCIHDKDKVMKLLMWVLKGFNQDFLERASKSRKPMKKLKEEYTQELTEYLSMLSKGL